MLQVTSKLSINMPADREIRFIKVDVEGSELDVFRGGLRVLETSRPFVVFEHGLGASDMYGSRPEQVFTLFEQCGMGVSLLSDWLDAGPSLSQAEFARQFDTDENYYFIAHPNRSSTADR